MKSHKLISLALCMFSVAFPVAHVGSPQSKVDKNAAKICTEHKNWTEERCTQVVQHRVLLGMTTEMVHESWGRLGSVNTRRSQDGQEIEF